MQTTPLEFIAPMVVAVVLIVTTAGVILLRPLARRLGELLHAITQEKLSPTQVKELGQMRELFSTMESRLALLEERQTFTESLLDAGRRRQDAGLPSAAPRADAGLPGVQYPPGSVRE